VTLIGVRFSYRIIGEFALCLPPPLAGTSSVTTAVSIANTLTGNLQYGTEVSCCSHIGLTRCNRIWINRHWISDAEGGSVAEPLHSALMFPAEVLPRFGSRCSSKDTR
jgi:hypothetical protein